MDKVIRLEEIQKRLAKAPTRPWVARHHEDGRWVIDQLINGLDYDSANFVARAPDDIAFLLSEVKRLLSFAEEVKAAGFLKPVKLNAQDFRDTSQP